METASEPVLKSGAGECCQQPGRYLICLSPARPILWSPCTWLWEKLVLFLKTQFHCNSRPQMGAAFHKGPGHAHLFLLPRSHLIPGGICFSHSSPPPSPPPGMGTSQMQEPTVERKSEPESDPPADGSVRGAAVPHAQSWGGNRALFPGEVPVINHLQPLAGLA